MISYRTALYILKKSKIRIRDEKIKAKNSKNRISSHDIFSSCNHPYANNSAFDGFAVNSKDTKKLNNKKPRKFKILKTLAAGDNPNKIKSKKFSTIEVMTGAVIKKPYDTVIPIEQIKFYPSSKNPKYIIIYNKISKNNYIRFAGSDFKKGQKILTKGDIIQPSHIMAFKTLGINDVIVKKKINIAFYTTGNEISNAKKIQPWKVRNSNGFYLDSYIENFPINFKEKKVLRDKDTNVFKKELKLNLNSKNDIIITSGAVSAGKFDFVPKILKNFKLSKNFKGVSIRPGKPIMFAKFKGKEKVFFGLPGNPISSAACFKFFVLPFIFFSTEMKIPKIISAKLKKNFKKKINFTRFIKGKLTVTSKGIVEFEPLKGQESFKIKSFTDSNCWGLFSNGKSKFSKGDVINCYTSSVWNELFL